jgi:hypothetical protein
MIHVRTIAAILSAVGVVSLAGCKANPSKGQPYYGASSNYYGAANNSPKPVDISDLYNTESTYAIKQLKSRGFDLMGQTHSQGFENTWWFNRTTHQCFQLEAAGGRVMTLNSRRQENCHTPGGRSLGKQSGGAVPQTAKAACIKRFGVSQYEDIKTISPLKPGWWEIIVRGKNSRQVACTADQNGTIGGWVEM